VQIQGYRDNKVPLKGCISLEWIDGTVFCAIRWQHGLIELFFAFGRVLNEKNLLVKESICPFTQLNVHRFEKCLKYTHILQAVMKYTLQ